MPDRDLPEPRPRKIDPHKITTHPTRRAILAIFEAERDLEASAVDLYRRPEVWGDANKLELSSLNYHCVVLEDAGLLEVVRREQVRGAVKRVFALSEDGRVYLDGQGGILAANVVLDKMAAIIRRVGEARRAGVPDLHQTENAYEAIVGLIESTGRDIGGAA